MESKVSASPDETKPDPFADLAAELRRAAADLSDLIGSGLPEPAQFEFNIQPGESIPNGERDDEVTARAVDAMAMALLGKPGEPQLMSKDHYFYSARGQRGPITVTIYQSISTAWVEKRHAAVALAEKEAELAKLRAEVEELRASQGFGPEDYQRFFPEQQGQPVDPTGLNFSREADDPTPVSPARVPLHEGAIVDGNQLVDETPKFALDAEVWVLLPSGPVPGVVVGLNGGEDYAVKTPDGRDLFGVTPSQMRLMEAWETAVVSDRLAEAIEPVADSGPEGLCWVRVPTLAGPDRPCSQPIERDPLSPSGFVHIEGGWRGHAAKPLVSDETLRQAEAFEGAAPDMQTRPQCSPECLALDKDFSGYGVKVHLVSCPVGHAEAQR